MQIETLNVNTKGNDAKAAANKRTSRPVSIFILLTRDNNALARLGSSTVRIPVPSTSQRPLWAMFHKPLSDDFLYPMAKNSGCVFFIFL